MVYENCFTFRFVSTMIRIMKKSFLGFMVFLLVLKVQASQFAICHSQLDEHYDVFFHVFLMPNKDKPEYANVNVDVYKDLLWSKANSVRFPGSTVNFVTLPEVSSITSKDQQLKIDWYRKDESSSFEEINRIMWVSPLIVSADKLVSVKCTILPE